jgi:hypothetical protein
LVSRLGRSLSVTHGLDHPIHLLSQVIGIALPIGVISDKEFVRYQTKSDTNTKHQWRQAGTIIISLVCYAIVHRQTLLDVQVMEKKCGLFPRKHSSVSIALVTNLA